MQIISKNNIIIRVTKERLHHILTNHPEMIDYIEKLSSVISDPDKIFQGERQECIAIKDSKLFYLVVIYKEEMLDGFIITAFKTRSIHYLLKRKLIWQKQ